MTELATPTMTSHRALVMFIALRGLRYPIHPIWHDECTCTVAYDVAAGVDHAFAAGVMRHLIGDYTDATSPAEDITQLVSLAINSSEHPRKLAAALHLAVVDAVDTTDPWPGKDTWTAAEQATNELHVAIGRLIEETFRRHLAASNDKREAARSVRTGLIAAVRVAAAEYLGEDA